MRSSVTGIQFRILEISVSDICERPALVNVAQMPIESSRANVTFLRSNIKYFGLVEQRNDWTIGPYEMQGIVMYSLGGDDRINPFTPNDPYRFRTAPLTSKFSFYIFIQQILAPNILNMVYTLRFFLFKMQFVS